MNKSRKIAPKHHLCPECEGKGWAWYKFDDGVQAAECSKCGASSETTAYENSPLNTAAEAGGEVQ